MEIIDKVNQIRADLKKAYDEHESWDKHYKAQTEHMDRYYKSKEFFDKKIELAPMVIEHNEEEIKWYKNQIEEIEKLHPDYETNEDLKEYAESIEEYKNCIAKNEKTIAEYKQDKKDSVHSVIDVNETIANKKKEIEAGIAKNEENYKTETERLNAELLSISPKAPKLKDILREIDWNKKQIEDCNEEIKELNEYLEIRTKNANSSQKDYENIKRQFENELADAYSEEYKRQTLFDYERRAGHLKCVAKDTQEDIDSHKQRIEKSKIAIQKLQEEAEKLEQNIIKERAQKEKASQIDSNEPQMGE